MKKFAFLALLFFIFYIAGMYESPALLVLFLTQIFLMSVMFVLSVYLNRHLRAGFADKLVWAEKDNPFIWKLKTENNGKLPVSRFLMKLRVSQNEDEEGEKRKVSGSSDRGADCISYEDTAGHCGILTYQAASLKVFDYLSLFSWKQHTADKMEVAVFPRRYEMKIETGDASVGNEEQYQQSSYLTGSSYEEIRQIREYRDGDSIRHIHWNQTARTDQLWVKEYEEAVKGSVRIFLDCGSEQVQHPADRDGFYTLLWALLSGLLKTVSSVHVFWREKEKAWISAMELSGEEQCRNLFFLLYRTEIGKCRKEEVPSGVMRLTGDLSWFTGDRLVFRFSGEKLEEELAQRIFRI